MSEMTDEEILAAIRPMLRINYHTIHARENQSAVGGIEYFIEHPLVEKLNGSLLECPVHDRIKNNPRLHAAGVYYARPKNLYESEDWEVRKA